MRYAGLIIDRDSIGGFVGGGPDKPADVQIGGCWCGPSYFVGSDGTGRIVSSGGTTVQTWKVNTSASPQLVADGKAASFAAFVQDSGFFTTVSSNGAQANTAVTGQCRVRTPPAIHPTSASTRSIGRRLGANLATLFHYNAGTWPNTGGNANVVPLEANGKVYVATYQQLAIFGLAPPAKKRPRVAQMVRALEVPMAPPPIPFTGSRFYGTIAGIDGSRLTITLRTSDTLTVDLTAAAKNFRMVIPVVGES
jgi:hypothetical protein